MKRRRLFRNYSPGAVTRRPGRANPAFRRERGITLILVLVLLLITAAASAFFHNSMVGSTRISGADRDNTASLVLAESAMEMLRGRLLNGLDDDAGDPDVCVDTCELHQIVFEEYLSSSTDVISALAGADYVYFAGDGSAGVSRTSPSILQKVANGEAVMLQSSTPVTSNEVGIGTNEILIEDLFAGSSTPILFTTGPNDNCSNATDNADGLLVDSACSSWAAQKAAANYNGTVATAWAEITQNQANAAAMDLWVQSAAQVGMAKSYLQRYVGTFYPPSPGGGLSDLGVLVEAANFDRRVQP